MRIRLAYTAMVIVAIGSIGALAYGVYAPTENAQQPASVSGSMTAATDTADTAVPLPTPRTEDGRYIHEYPAFSVIHPEGFTVGVFPEGEGEAVLFQKRDNPRQGVQLFITPFDEVGLLTIGRIRADLPDLAMERPAQIVIGDTIQGVGFFNGSEAHAWFVHGDFLYQVSSSRSMAPVLGEMLSTFAVE